MVENSHKIKSVRSAVFRFARVVVVLAAALAVAKLLIILKEKPQKKEIVQTPPSVKVMVAEPVSKTMTVEAYGTVKPRKLVKIAVEVPGRINYLHPSFIEGGMIDRGTLLIGIDQRSYKLEQQAGQVRIRQAETDIAMLKQDVENLKNDILLSRANLDLAGKELERIKTLTRNQFASKNSLDKAEQQYLQARIQLQAIRNRLSVTDTLMEQKNAALAMARVDFQKADLALQKTQIRSGFDGYVLDKFVEKGEYVSPGQILGSVYQKNSLDVDVRIPLEQMKWIEAFFRNGKTPDARVTAVNSGGTTSYVWNAGVARLKAEIDEKTRTLPMTLEISTLDGVEMEPIFGLKPGTFVKCSIIGQRYDNIFVLPRHLLKGDDSFFTVNDSHLKITKVTVLRKFEEEVYISGGLNPGDKIITSPLPGAREGMALKVQSNGK